MVSNVAMQEVADYHQDPHNVYTRIHYYRKCGCYEDWGLPVWGNAKAPMQWQRMLEPTGSDEYGVYWEVNFLMDSELHFVVHKGDTKDCEATFTSHKDSGVWLVLGRSTIFTEIPPRITSSSLAMSRL